MFMSPVVVLYLAACAVAAPVPLVLRSLEGEQPESLFARGFLLKTLTKVAPSVIKTTKHLEPGPVHHTSTKVHIPEPPAHVPGHSPKSPSAVSPSKFRAMLHLPSPKTAHNQPGRNPSPGHVAPQQERKHPTTAHPLKAISHPDTHSTDHGATHPTLHTEHGGHAPVLQQNGFGTSGSHPQRSTHPVNVPRTPTTHEFHHEDDRPRLGSPQWATPPAIHRAEERAILGHEIRHDLAAEHRVEEMHQDARLLNAAAGVGHYDGLRPLQYGGERYGGWMGQGLY